ncbi:uncharacterized protein N7458_009600 [Penicillium daleae]|uniref:Uncharacterized protein n=1 Tax=Penicillium daleae TaxID=63821 RepID=A0AAD6BXR6_9EURO|nr:uncharacterized protein N7458_009600 [Penicillium daleae]KAJ5438602.1 hypothetical protein N7458_009600 [Penicillium daleae]
MSERSRGRIEVEREGGRRGARARFECMGEREETWRRRLRSVTGQGPDDQKTTTATITTDPQSTKEKHETAQAICTDARPTPFSSA